MSKRLCNTRSLQTFLCTYFQYEALDIVEFMTASDVLIQSIPGNYFSLLTVIIASGFGGYIAFKIKKIQDKQTEVQEETYKEDTIRNVKKIYKYFVDVEEISHDTIYGNSEQQYIITEKLLDFYSNNYPKMKKLYDDTVHSLDHWKTHKSGNKTKYNEIIANFNWLVNTYFPINSDDELSQKISWTSQYSKLVEQKNDIDEHIHALKI